MAVSESYLNYIVEQLSFADVTSKRMFGAVGLYSGGIFFGVIDNNTLYFKTGDANRPDYVNHGSRPFQPYGEGSYSMSYYEVPAAVIEDPEKLSEWFKKSLSVARNKKKKSVRKG